MTPYGWQQEPYRLADEVDGVGFRTADAIATGLGITRDDPRRIAAGLRYALGQASNDGHCYLPTVELIERASGLLSVTKAAVSDVFTQMLAHHQLWRDPVVTAADPDQYPIYLPPLAFAEIGVANAIRRLLQQYSSMADHYVPSRWELVFAHLAKRHGMNLSAQQRTAVRTALTTSVMLLTGGPGTENHQPARPGYALACSWLSSTAGRSHRTGSTAVE